MADDDDFLWSRQTYSLKHFVCNFEHKLPVLVNVAQGYCGVDELLDISKGQIYIIIDVKRQKRAVVQTSNDLSLSVPVDYPLDFVVTSDPKKKAQNLETILKLYDYGDEDDDLFIVPHHSDKVSFACSFGTNDKKAILFDSLQIVNDYDDIYLVAVPVVNGHVYQRKASIPVFVDIKVTQAKGVRNTTNPNYFNQILANLHIEATSFHCSESTGNPEIMLYVGTAKQLSDYEYIEPQHYITCRQASAVREQRKVTAKSKLAITDDVTAPDAPIRPPKPDSHPRTGRREVPEPPQINADVESYEYPTLHNKPVLSQYPPIPKPRRLPTGAAIDDRKYINQVPIQPVAPSSKTRPDSQYAIAEQPVAKQVPGSTSEYEIVAVPMIPIANCENKQTVKNKLRKGKSKEHQSDAVSNTTPVNNDDDVYQDVCVPKVIPKVPQKPQRRRTGKNTSAHERKLIVSKPEQTIQKEHTSSREEKQRVNQALSKIEQNVANPENISTMDLSSIPDDITHLSKYQITDCLLALKLDKYADAFLDQDIDGDLLSTLTDEQMFIDEFQFKAFEARKLVKFIKGWRPNTQATTKL